jgi:hypothetical protein
LYIFVGDPKKHFVMMLHKSSNVPSLERVEVIMIYELEYRKALARFDECDN